MTPPEQRIASVSSCIDRVALTLWVGSLWTIGLIAAPVLFRHLERAQAGTVAGALFEIGAWIGLGCGTFLLATRWVRGGRRLQGALVLILLMLVLTMIGQFLLAPAIAALRENGAVDTAQFGRLHGLSSVLYLANCLMGLLLVIGRR